MAALPDSPRAKLAWSDAAHPPRRQHADTTAVRRERLI